MELLEGVVRHYDWGSTTSIPELLGLAPTGEPWAELWLGAHPSAPALVGAGATPLDDVIAGDPAGVLGPAVYERFGELPFLLKVLAAGAPLSLQAHPSIAQAEAGYAREDELGVPVDAPDRSFRDRMHKPELICALTPFRALCGFRDPNDTAALFDSIATSALDPVSEQLLADPSATGLHSLLEWLLGLEGYAAAALADPVVGACADALHIDPTGQWSQEHAMALALGERYPGDAGVITALLLNLLTLQPGEALFLSAGNLHAYLEGTGVEIMANSDNVLRGGLTTKHVDVPTLLDVVEARPIVPQVQRPAATSGVATYDTPVPEFSLQRVDVDGSITVDGGPAIFLCTAGCAQAGDHTLDRGAAAWVDASEGSVDLVGYATVFRAAAGPA